MSEWKTSLQILVEQPSFSMDLTRLGQELINRRAIGFSADPNGSDEFIRDIVDYLEKQGYVTYNSETEVIMLLPAKIIKKFLDQMDIRTSINTESPKIKSELTHEQELRLDYSQPPVSSEKLKEIKDRLDRLEGKPPK